MVLIVSAGDDSASENSAETPPCGDYFVSAVLTSRALSQEAVDRIWSYVRPVDIPQVLRSDVRPPSRECWESVLPKADAGLRSAIASCLQDPAEVRSFAEACPESVDDLNSTWLLREASEFSGKKAHREYAAAYNAAAAALELDKGDPSTDPDNRVLGSSVSMGMPAFRDAVLGLMTNQERRAEMVKAVMGAVHTDKTARFMDIVAEMVSSGAIDTSADEWRLPPGVTVGTVGGVMYSLAPGYERMRPLFDWKQSISAGLSKMMADRDDPALRAELGSLESSRKYVLDRYGLYLAQGEDELAATLIMHSSVIAVLSAAESAEKAWEVYYEAVDLLPPSKWLKWASGEFREPLAGLSLPPQAAVEELAGYGPGYRAELLSEISAMDAGVLSAIAAASDEDEEDDGPMADQDESADGLTAASAWKVMGTGSQTPYTDQLDPSLRLLAWPMDRVMSDPAEADRDMTVLLAAYYAVSRTAGHGPAVQADVVEAVVGDGTGASRTVCEVVDDRLGLSPAK